jgi:hypothetical protein
MNKNIKCKWNQDSTELDVLFCNDKGSYVAMALTPEDIENQIIILKKALAR